MLVAREVRAHGGERDLNAVPLERASKLEGVRPHTADWIGGHQNSPRRGARGWRSHRLNRVQWRPRSSSRFQDQTWNPSLADASTRWLHARTIRPEVQTKFAGSCR